MHGYMRHFIANSRNLYNQWLNKVILEDVMCLTWSFNPDSSWSSKFIVLIIIKRHRSPCVYILYVLISSRRRSVQTWKAWEMSTKSHCLLEPAIKIKPRARWEAVKIHFLTKFQKARNLKKTNLIASTDQMTFVFFFKTTWTDYSRCNASWQNYGPADSQLSKS